MTTPNNAGTAGAREGGMLTKQQIFDKVATHLFTQGRPAKVGTEAVSCRYRTTQGLSCAVGCLIPDDRYDPSIEGADVWNLRHSGAWTKVLPNVPVNSDTYRLLDSLQSLHDGADTTRAGRFDRRKLRAGLRAVALDYGISPATLDTLARTTPAPGVGTGEGS